MIWKGKGVVKTGRKMLGETNPADSAPGSIRGDFSIDIGRNIIHGSDAVESAEKEIALWFKEVQYVCFFFFLGGGEGDWLLFFGIGCGAVLF